MKKRNGHDPEGEIDLPEVHRGLARRLADENRVRPRGLASAIGKMPKRRLPPKHIPQNVLLWPRKRDDEAF